MPRGESITIHADLVTRVLLGGEWVAVEAGSFRVGYGEYRGADAAGAEWYEHVQTHGDMQAFQFINHQGLVVAGPLTSVQAVRYLLPKRDDEE